VNLPKIIFFDAVGTLFGVRSSVGEIYAQFAKQAGLDVDISNLNSAFFESFRAAPRAAFSGAAPLDLPRLEYEWWRAVAQKSFERVGALAQLSDFDAFFRPLFIYFETEAPWIVYPETLKALEMLKSLEIELAIISNFDSRLYAVLEVLGLADWFGSVTLSTQIGAPKPEAEIFKLALAKHPYLPTQAWHVGDSWTEDYEGAIAVGFQGVWLNRDGAESSVTRVGTSEIEVLEISNLMALQKILQPQG
jgi:putative hydrolase of the HAD superfamily